MTTSTTIEPTETVAESSMDMAVNDTDVMITFDDRHYQKGTKGTRHTLRGRDLGKLGGLRAGLGGRSESAALTTTATSGVDSHPRFAVVAELKSPNHERKRLLPAGKARGCSRRPTGWRTRCSVGASMA